MSSYQLLVTGRYFTGHEFRAVQPAVEEIILSAQDEVTIIAYLIAESAVDLLLKAQQAAARGVRVIFILNKPWTFSPVVRKNLLDMKARFPHVEIYAFDDVGGGELHAKVVIADRKKAVIGSANLSWGGMVVNHEVGVLVEGEPVWVLAGVIDRLISNLLSWNSQ
ncbi:MAG: endonuclease [Armatimonadota bacterium]|nr:MAG: endonuclease [Armatimonadota bacterium]